MDWNLVQFHPNPLQHMWIDTNTCASKQGLTRISNLPCFIIAIAIALTPKIISGSTTINQELSTLAAGGTAWKGRLRSHHTTPQSFPMQRLPSQTNNMGEEEDLQTLKKQASLKKTVRGCHSRAVRQLLRLDGRDSEHPIMIDNEVNEV